jgi:hypothetical protein
MRIVVGVVAAGLALAPATAAELPPAVLACASEVQDAARLACYDSAVKAASAEARRRVEAREVEGRKAAEAAAAAAAAAAVAAEASAEEARKAAFGKPRDESAVAGLTAVIQEVLRDATGKAVFVLDNGQIWRQADGFSLPSAKVGVAVELKRGALGSYRLVPANSNRSVQVIRMR